MASQDWLNNLNNLGDKPTYTSKYQGQLDTLLDKIVNREGFSYDFNADPLYQQYKDNYTKLGNEASMNAAANVSSLTGGYGNSYAATAASQANQQYLTQLNNVIPQLEAAAMDKYQMETENLYNQYGAVGNAEDRAYGQYRDAVNDYYTDRDYYYNGYNNERNYEYQQNRDVISDAQWRESFDYNKGIDDRNFNYQKERDAVSDAQWEKQYQMALQKMKASGSGSSGKGSVASNAGKQTTVRVGDQQLEAQEYAASANDFNKYQATAAMLSAAELSDFVDSLLDNNKISDYQANVLRSIRANYTR